MTFPKRINYCAGADAFLRGDHKEALYHWLPLAEMGDAQSQNGLATMYLNGIGVPKNEIAAAKLFQRAAKQELPHAQLSLGHLYRTGRGVRKSPSRAVKLYRRAAEKGYEIYTQLKERSAEDES